MASRNDVRKIAMALPGTHERDGDFAFEVRTGSKSRLLAWSWKERVDPRKARVPNPDVLAVRVADLGIKELLLQSDPRIFFTEPHYDGYPAVLVRLKAITRTELRALLADSRKTMEPKTGTSRNRAG